MSLEKEKYDEPKKMNYEELKEMKFEFIQNATVKVLRLNDNLLKSPTLLMFRVHNMIEVMEDDPSINNEQIVSTGLTTCGHFDSPSVQIFPGPCFDLDYFTKFVRSAIYNLNLFDTDRNKLLGSKLITNYFHSCFNNNVMSVHPAFRPKFVIVIEVLRKYVYIGNTNGEHPCRFNKPAKKIGKSSLDILRDGEDYSEVELQDILGSIYDLKIKHGRELSTNSPAETDRLSQVKATIRILTFNGKITKHEEKDECPICLKRFRQREPIAKMPCSHMFHKNCAFKWLIERADSCPYCRSVCKSPII